MSKLLSRKSQDTRVRLFKSCKGDPHQKRTYVSVYMYVSISRHVTTSSDVGLKSTSPASGLRDCRIRSQGEGLEGREDEAL